MSDLGTIAYLTLEPGNSTNEEQISFTGLTQNANGTCTLSGVSSVGFVYPYTSTSGLAKTHAGATTAVLSNTAAFYNEFVNKNTDGTVNSLITFSSANIPTQDSYKAPTLDAQFAPKKYVDDVAVSGAPDASTSTKGIVQIATQAQVDAKTILGSTSAYLMQSLDTQRSTLLSDYVADTSASPNIITIAPSPAITVYTTGQTFSFKLANTNTSPTVTLNANGVGAKNVILNNTASPSAGVLTSGGIVTVEYDGTNFQVQSSVQSPTGSIIMFGGSTAPGGWLLCNGSPVSRTTYATLFDVIGTLFGTGDGSTTFNVPNMGGRFVAGPSASLSNTIGATGGTLTATSTPVVTDNYNSPNGFYSGISSGYNAVASTTVTGGSFAILPPYVITNYIIKT